jgi:hypothetical protein
MKQILILSLFMIINQSILQSQCGITSANPGSTLIFNNTSVASNTFSQRVVRIQGTTLFTEDVTFVNCDIYLDANFRYSHISGAPIARYKFKDCKIFLDGIFRSTLGFNPTPVQFEFDGSCIKEMDPGGDESLGEIMHLESGGLVFINNTVDITDGPHMFHLKNMDLNLENAFYGNIVNYSIVGDIQNWDAFIQIDQRNGDYKIGDAYQAKNVFTINGNAITNFGTINGKITLST